MLQYNIIHKPSRNLQQGIAFCLLDMQLCKSYVLFTAIKSIKSIVEGKSASNSVWLLYVRRNLIPRPLSFFSRMHNEKFIQCNTMSLKTGSRLGTWSHKK